LAAAPDAFLPVDFAARQRVFRSLESAQQVLEGLDMEVLPAFRLSREHTLEQGVIQKRGDPPLALASKGVMVTRPRSKYAKEVVNAAFKALPEEGFLSRAVVAASMVDKFFADGGAENALGRLERAYPQTGTHHLEAITAAEAAQALRECGIDMSLIPSAALRPFSVGAPGGWDCGCDGQPQVGERVPNTGQVGDGRRCRSPHVHGLRGAAAQRPRAGVQDGP